MSTSSYRIRRPAWLWAILASILSGLTAAAAFSLILVLILRIMDLASPGWSIAADTGTNWLLFSGIAVGITIGTAVPIIATVAVVAAVTLSAVRTRRGRTRSNLLLGYEWLIWATIFVAALTYPWIAQPLGFDAIWGAKYYEAAYPFLLVLAISLACAYIARPMFYGIVSRNHQAEIAENTVPDTTSPPGGHAHVHA